MRQALREQLRAVRFIEANKNLKVAVFLHFSLLYRFHKSTTGHKWWVIDHKQGKRIAAGYCDIDGHPEQACRDALLAQVTVTTN